MSVTVLLALALAAIGIYGGGAFILFWLTAFIAMVIACVVLLVVLLAISAVNFVRRLIPA